PEDDDGLRRLAGLVDDLDLARLDDEELEVAVSRLEQLLAVRMPLENRPGARTQLGDLSGVQLGECGGVQLVVDHGPFLSAADYIPFAARVATRYTRVHESAA